MKWLRLLVLLFLVAAVALAISMRGALLARAESALEALLERELSAVLHTPFAVESLDLSLWPLGVDATGVTLGPDGAVARVGAISLRLLPRTSLRQRRPVVDATLDGVSLDVPALTAMIDTLVTPGTPPTVLPRFRVRIDARAPIVELTSGARALQANGERLRGNLTAEGAAGRLRFAGAASRVLLRCEDRWLEITSLRARGGEAADGWHLREVEVAAVGIELHGRAEANRLPLTGRVTLAKLAILDPTLGDVGGEAEITAALLGTLQQPTLEGSVHVATLSIGGRDLGDAQVDASLASERLTVGAARLRGFGGETTGEGTLTFAADLPYQARLHWTGLNLREVASASEQVLKPATATGQAEVAGTFDPLTLTGSGDGTVAAIAGGSPVEWRGNGDYRAGSGRFEIDAAQAGVNTVRARLELGPGEALEGSIDATVGAPPALGVLLPIENAPTLSGSLSVSARLSGSTAEPHVDGTLRGRDVALLGVNVERLDGALALDRHMLGVSGLRAELWQGSVALDGALALDQSGENDWRLKVDKVPGGDAVALVYGASGTLLPIGRGVLSATLAAQGAWPRVRMSGSATLTQFWLTQQWLQEATVSGSTAWPRWQLDGAMRNQGGQVVTVRGNGTGTDQVALQAHTDAWQLTALERGDLTETGGRFALDASFNGPLFGLNGRATLSARDLALSGRQIGTLDVEVSAARGRWQAATTLLGGAVELRAGLTPETGWPLTLDGQWNDADFGPLLVSNAEVVVESTGTLQARAPLSALDQLSATMRVERLRIVNGPYALAAVRPTVLTCRQGSCRLEGLELQGADTLLEANGTFAVDGSLRLAINGRGDLRLLELAGKPIESARGRFTINADIRRAAGTFTVNGGLQVEQAGLDVGGPTAITRANGRLTLSGTAVRIDELGGRLGTGTFGVGGGLDLQHGPDLTWMLTDVGLIPVQGLEAEVSGHGTLGGVWQRLRLAGELKINRMLYDRNLELTDLLPSFNRALAAAPRPPSERQLELDLNVVAPGELYVENNLARIEGQAHFRLSGTAEHPIIAGRIEALDGEVIFRDRSFELQGATVDFRPDLGMVAALNISAESTIDTPDATYTVGVLVTGTTRDPRIVLTSDDPGLTQTDIATLIAVGKTTSQLREGGGGFSFYDALGMVPKEVTEGIQQGASHFLPIDRISFESTYSRTSGTYQPQLKLGKDLTDNLAVSIGQTFGVESRTIFEGDYRLSPRIYIPVSWESQTESQEGAFFGGVKVRYEFWRVTPYTLLGLGALR